MLKPLRSVEILLVEDSPSDRLITIEALNRSKVINSLHTVENGVDAMAYLRREGPFSAARRPDLILLDLNLPKKDGREVLEEIKSDPLLKVIPVVVLTTSQSDEDLLRAYGSHANSYITKPVDFPRFTAALQALGGYWFEVVTLPPERPLERSSREWIPKPIRVPVEHEQSVRVLVIEDNPVDVLLLRDALQESRGGPFEMYSCARLDEACRRLQAEHFDLVMTDLGLPDSQGLETYRRVARAAPGLPVIVLTGLDDEDVGLLALREGAHDFLEKGQLSGRALARAARYAIDKKRYEEQLRRSQKLEAVGRLAAGVAHDFNNIITVVRANADLIALGGEVDVAAAVVEIGEAAERASALARQLLTFSRQQKMRMERLDLNHLIGNFARILRRILGERVGLELRLGADTGSVFGDEGMLEQVILNFAVNAREAMPLGGKFTVETAGIELTPDAARAHVDAYAGLFTVLTVTDTGTGIAAAVLSKVFEPYYSTKERGTGVGLATVHAIVQQHRGWVSVASQVGAGTTFEVYLPTATTERTVADPASLSVAGASESGTILLVEDDAPLRALTKRVLVGQGYRVLDAASIDEAMVVFEEHKDAVDVVFTDLMLAEGQSGGQLASELIQLMPGLRFVFTSGYSPETYGQGVVLEPGTNFLPKPYSLRQLLDILGKQR